MFNLDINILLLILVSTAIIYLISYFYTPQSNRRLYLTFITCSVLIYSGMGIAFEEVDNKYLVKYLAFISVLLITLLLFFKLNTSNNFSNQPLITTLDLTLDSFKWVYFLLSLVYILSLFIHLLVPVVRISDLWNPPSSSLLNIFARRDDARANIILYFADFINITLKPFFFIYLYLLKKSKKTLSLSLWILVWVYLDYLKLGYMGRSDMIAYAIFIFFIFILNTEKGFQLRKRHLYAIIIGIILTVPFLHWYESFRLGSNVVDTSFKDSFMELFKVETDYPKYFSSIEYMTEYISPLDYYLWLVALPIPTVLMPNKYSLGINAIFSSALLGVSRGQYGYYVILPSILGEAFMVYSMSLYWIHAIIIGILVGYICRLSEKSKALTILNIYYAVNLLEVGRGGSQGYFGEVINGSLSLVLFALILKLMTRKYKQSHLNNNKNNICKLHP